MKTSFTIKSMATGLGIMALSLMTDASTNPAHATCTDEPYIASICATAANFCPRGYVRLDGQYMSISQEAALFSLLGTNFGGDGRTTFGVPDLRGRSAIHDGQGPGLSDVILGQRRGYERVTPTVLTMANHTHAAGFIPDSSGGSDLTVDLHAATNSSPDVKTPTDGSFIGQVGTGIGATPSFVTAPTGTAKLGGVVVSGGGSSGGTVILQNTGGSQSQVNLPPQLTLTFCMATRGLFPPRS